jgi:hypothetical protein
VVQEFDAGSLQRGLDLMDYVEAASQTAAAFALHVPNRVDVDPCPFSKPSLVEACHSPSGFELIARRKHAYPLCNHAANFKR